METFLKSEVGLFWGFLGAVGGMVLLGDTGTTSDVGKREWIKGISL